MNRDDLCPPDGFEPLFRSSHFLDSVGRFYSKGRGESFVVGAYVEERATNGRGLAHAGFLAGFADVALGYAAATTQAEILPLVTVNLNLDFVGAARLGDWVEAIVQVQKIGKRLAFANAYLVVGDQRIVRASAVFARADG
jgi:acyl-coenzyme A thioesterase 13